MGKRVYEYSVDSHLPPERVIGAATDFSRRRPDLWPSITRSQYHVYSLSAHTADVEEGTAPTKHRVQYRWTESEVTGTTIAANAVEPGSVWRLRVSALPGDGSHIEVRHESAFRGPLGFMLQTVIALGGGARFFEKSLRRTLDIVEREPPTAEPGS